ncbi:hypothetical protein LCC91_06705 [Tepidimonas taiwanensis]|uniref:Uncharacterized protein n=1 Tax=Tepidimonas taiwanensis TaxID=307486 RepID=A0A554XCY8_9BURK|nr:hypothetical protein [Tepidimonas taiwanensis]TSE33707.1 hypothetical protein Ttaiw_00271 [Tepidimonas taiwanensis]UBQ04275.1 hypothetical protein LCC91_06705 [Tepidimonas taiwanensis]
MKKTNGYDSCNPCNTVTPKIAQSRHACAAISPPSCPLPPEVLREAFEEWAAIAQYDGGLTREAAEALAWQEVLKLARRP